MSNKSYPIKENSIVMKVQGGEQKVMKKILTVALSTAMAFSMFASVAFGDSAVSVQEKYDSLKAKGIFNGYPDQQAHLERDMTRAEFAKVLTKLLGLKEVTGTLSYKDKGYNAKNWAVPYIEAVTAAGIMEGQDKVKQIFNYNGKVTVQEMATALVRALKLEVPANADNSASTWAKGYVQAAIDKGLISKDLNFQANATREQLVNAAYQAEQIINLSVKSYKVADNGKDIEFTLSSGEVVKVTLEKALEPNKETEVKFKNAAGQEITAKVTWVVTEATKVDKVTATNLKEAVVSFDGKVDKETAEEVSNYTLKSGKAIKSAVLSDDEKTVTLTLSGTLANNKADFLSVSNVKAGNKTISAKEVEFTAADNQLPEVTSVKSLGTKSVKVVFSEPVQLPAQNKFELDGKTYFGKIAQPTSRTIILTPYNTAALSVGAHKLVVSGINDFANFVSLTSTHDFTVVEDKEAPTITESSATLETVTLTFSEEVDADTIKASNVYWKSGDSKKTAKSFEVIEDNKVKFTFDRTNALPTGAVTVYVDGVKDYSGNQIASGTSVIVNAVIDQTRPEVKKATVVDSKTIKVVFSKSLLESSAENKANYTVVNKDNKVLAVKSADLGGTNNNEVTIELYSALSAGDNTLTIKNVKDNTRLENTMLDYSGTINAADTEVPEVDSVLVKPTENIVILGFSKKMDPATLQDLSNYNYLVGTDNNGNTERKPLTGNIADITVFNDSNAVAIRFAEDVKLATGKGNISRLYILGLKDTAGNLLKQFTSNSNYSIDLTQAQGLALSQIDSDYNAEYKAQLVGKSDIEVKFSAGVSAVSSGAFTVKNTVTGDTYAVNSVDVDGTSKVKLNFKDSVLNTTYAENLVVDVDYGKLTTLAGNITGTGSTKVLDKVAPEFKGDNVKVDGQELTATFTEDVTLDAAANKELLAKDFEITRYFDGKKLVAGNDFVVKSVAGNKVVIELKDAASRKYDTTYTVKFLGSKYLTDTTVVKNQAATFEKETTNVVKGQ